MRPTTLRYAASITPKPLATSSFRTAPTSPSAKAVAEQLLSPVPLYRRLLRVHRKALPIEMRVMGDEYIKAEFRRTRTTDNPLHIVGFLSEWKKYLDFHEAQVAIDAAEGIEGKGEGENVERRKEREGRKLDSALFDKLSSDQLGQLYELLQATKQVWTDPKDLPQEDEEALERSALSELGLDAEGKKEDK